MGTTRQKWIMPVLWLLLIGDSLLLAISVLFHWFWIAPVLLIQLLVITQELRGRSLISKSHKANTIGLLIILLIEASYIFPNIPHGLE